MLPTLLIITHLYCPESDRWTSVIVKLCLLFSDDAVSCRFVVVFSFSSFFVQVTLGEGFPSATQLNTTYSPSTMVASFGFSTISGATWNLKREVLRSVNSNKWISKATGLFLCIYQSPRLFLLFLWIVKAWILTSVKDYRIISILLIFIFMLILYIFHHLTNDKWENIICYFCQDPGMLCHQW